MVDTETMPISSAKPMIVRQTLAARLAQGRLPVGDALRYAMQLGEALRSIHDSGQFHGALTPSVVTLTSNGVALLPAPEEPGAMTRYTAPEVVRGGGADARSDVFSFGAILFEMLTGQPVFEGDGQILAGNLSNAATPLSGSPAADRVIGPCLAKSPDARTPRMQKILMELKLLAVAARRAETAAAPPTRRDPGMDTIVLRAEMQQMEIRMAARLSAHERTVSEIQRTAFDAVNSLKHEIAGLRQEIAGMQENYASRPAPGPDTGTSEQLVSQMEQGLAPLAEQVRRLDKTMEDLLHHTAQFERSVAADLLDIEQSIKGQSAAIDSARTAMSQTDDLVERVVEALESLQTAVLDHGETNAGHASFAVN
jgi:eukaryotic-like serine/threonine-protein kinase